MTHKFNNIEVRTPTSFSWDMKDLEGDSYIDGDGNRNYNLLNQKRTLNYGWLDPTKEEVSTILKLINEKGYIDITYPDAMSGEFETRKFSVLKRGAPMRDLRVGKLMYSALSLDFEEL